MTSDEEERLHAYIPEDLNRRLETADHSKKEQVVEALELYFGEAADNEEAIRRQLARMREQKARGEQLVQSGQDMIREAEENIDRLESKLHNVQESKRTYEQELDVLLETMRAENVAVFEDHGRVQDIAATEGKPATDVLDDLRERSDLGSEYFTPGPVDSGDDSPSISLGGGRE